MTKIYLHGKLGQIFGKFFKLKINNVLSALNGIDANRSGFLKKIFSLADDGLHYCVIANDKKIEDQNELLEKKIIHSIHIVPVIEGSGEYTAFALNLTEIAANGATVLSATGQLVAFLVNTAISLGISFIASALEKQASAPSSLDARAASAVGGATSAIEAAGKSYVFSNDLNTADQGSAIPIGYGKMKASSSILFYTISSYSTNLKYNEEFLSSSFPNSFSNFFAN